MCNIIHIITWNLFYNTRSILGQVPQIQTLRELMCKYLLRAELPEEREVQPSKTQGLAAPPSWSLTSSCKRLWRVSCAQRRPGLECGSWAFIHPCSSALDQGDPGASG